MKRRISPILAIIATIAYGALMFVAGGVAYPRNAFLMLAAFLCLSIIGTYVGQNRPAK